MFDLIFWFINRDHRVKAPILKRIPFIHLLVLFFIALANIICFSVWIIGPYFSDKTSETLYFPTSNARNFTLLHFFFEAFIVLVAFPFILTKVKIYFITLLQHLKIIILSSFSDFFNELKIFL